MFVCLYRQHTKVVRFRLFSKAGNPLNSMHPEHQKQMPPSLVDEKNTSTSVQYRLPGWSGGNVYSHLQKEGEFHVKIPQCITLGRGQLP